MAKINIIASNSTGKCKFYTIANAGYKTGCTRTLVLL